MAERSETPSRLWTRPFGLVLAIAMLSFIICQGNNNGTPIYVSFYGGTNLFAGLLILEFSIAAALSRVFLSARIDGGSRRRFMVQGAVFTLAGSFGAVIVPILEMQLVYRALQGFGFGLCTTAASTAAADVVPLKRLGEGLGYYGLGQSLGMVIGPSLAIVLVSFDYHESLFAGMSVLGLALLAATLCCTYEKHPERLDATCAYRMGSGDALRAAGPKGRGRLRPGDLFEKDALPGALPMVVICLGYSIITNFVSKYGVEAGLPNPGAYFIAAAVTMTVVRLAGGRLFDAVPPRILVVVPVLSGIASFVLLALDLPLGAFYVSGALFGLSMGLAFPLFNTVAVRCSPLDRRGAATALYLLANDLGVGTGAVLFGLVIDIAGYGASFWCGAIVLVATFVVAQVVFPKKTLWMKGA